MAKMFSKAKKKTDKNDKSKKEMMPANVAKDLILQGLLPENMVVSGQIDLSGTEDLRKLPKGLSATSLVLSNCPKLESLPPDLSVQFDLVLDHCESLESLPENLKVGSLSLQGCTALEALPEGLSTYFLNLSECANLKHWPQKAALRFGNLIARNCINLTFLPDWLGTLSNLDLRGCANIHTLPDNLVVNSWLDVAGTGISALPEGCQQSQLRWRGIPVDRRIAFQPETITVDEILNETNIELRRVKLERMGYERFIAAAEAELLDQDEDPGGERRLLRIEMPDEEPLVCISVRCPSTGRQYVIRVPPDMASCHQAAAWIAGFDDPDQYHPLIET